jgi:hypothetical protein
MTLSKDGGPAFGAHAFIWADEWTPEGAERVISGAFGVGLDFVEIPLLVHRPDVVGNPDALVRDGLTFFLRARGKEHGVL